MKQPEMAESALYSTFGDDAELAEIIELFVGRLPSRIGQMVSYFEAADWEELWQAAHQLKGAAGSYGFPSITDLSARLEECVKQSEPETEIRKTLSELGELCRKARAGAPARRS